MGWLLDDDMRIERDELDSMVAKVAAGFAACSIGVGDGVALCLNNEASYLVASAAASQVGAWVIGINWHAVAADVRYILADSGARLLVIHAHFHDRLRDAVPAGVQVVTVPAGAAVRRAYRLDPVPATARAGTLHWEHWLADPTPRTIAPAPLPNPVGYTSGTTGRPKGVRRPPFDAAAMAVLGASLAQIFGYGQFDPVPGAPVVTAALGPLYHMAPANHANFSLRIGADLILYPRFDAARLLADIERHRITHLNMVPIMFSRLLKLPAAVRARHDLSSLRHVVHAAAPCPVEIKRAMIDWWGPIITEFYGSTETGMISFSTSAEWLRKPGTVGRAAAGAEIRVLDADGQPLPPGTVGEVAGRMPGLDRFEYIGDPAKRAAVDRNGLVAVGDIGWLDHDGFLFLCDRKSDMIISGGVNIYPIEIEGAIAALPGVADCAVFGIPDDEFGEAVCAVIQPEPGADLDADGVRAGLEGRLAHYQWPKVIEFRAELPREDSGKIFKRRLRDPWWEGRGRAI